MQYVSSGYVGGLCIHGTVLEVDFKRLCFFEELYIDRWTVLIFKGCLFMFYSLFSSCRWIKSIFFAYEKLESEEKFKFGL